MAPAWREQGSIQCIEAPLPSSLTLPVVYTSYARSGWTVWPPMLDPHLKQDRFDIMKWDRFWPILVSLGTGPFSCRKCAGCADQEPDCILGSRAWRMCCSEWSRLAIDGCRASVARFGSAPCVSHRVSPHLRRVHKKRPLGIRGTLWSPETRFCCAMPVVGRSHCAICGWIARRLRAWKRPPPLTRVGSCARWLRLCSSIPARPSKATSYTTMNC